MIKIVQNALTKQECEELIKINQDSMIQAKTLGKNIDGYRTAKNSWINIKNDLTEKVKKIVFEQTNLPFENQETIHIVNYQIGGEYKKHYDFFNENTDYYEDTMKRGGNRVFTALFYLNDNFSGGETEFPKLNLKINPEVGKLIVWKNMNEDGTLNRDSIHAGLPVIEGEKWIAVVWVRERVFK